MVGSEGRKGARPGAGARPGGAFSHPAPRLPPPLRPGSRQEPGNKVKQGDVWDRDRQERKRDRQTDTPGTRQRGREEGEKRCGEATGGSEKGDRWGGTTESLNQQLPNIQSGQHKIKRNM